MSWCKLQCPFANLKIYSLKFKIDLLILKILLRILCFGICLKLNHIQVVISLHYDQLLLLIILQNFCSLFSYLRGVLVTNLFLTVIDVVIGCIIYIIGCSATCNIRRTFLITFLICSNLRNSFKRVGTIIITTGTDYNSL